MKHAHWDTAMYEAFAAQGRATRAANDAATRAAGQPVKYKKLRSGEADYSTTCPGCQGEKHKTAKMCQDCRDVHNDSLSNVTSIGRSQSIITFRHSAGEVQTRVCYGQGRDAQIRYGLALVGGPEDQDEWEIQSISTPASILSDLHRNDDGRASRAVPGRGWER